MINGMQRDLYDELKTKINLTRSSSIQMEKKRQTKTQNESQLFF
jgi:hypothetical protein